MTTLPPTAEIVTRKTQSLAVRTAALVRRGLRDLTVETHWRVRKVSAARAWQRRGIAVRANGCA